MRVDEIQNELGKCISKLDQIETKLAQATKGHNELAQDINKFFHKAKKARTKATGAAKRAGSSGAAKREH